MRPILFADLLPRRSLRRVSAMLPIDPPARASMMRMDPRACFKVDVEEMRNWECGALGRR